MIYENIHKYKNKLNELIMYNMRLDFSPFILGVKEMTFRSTVCEKGDDENNTVQAFAQ